MKSNCQESIILEGNQNYFFQETTQEKQLVQTASSCQGNNELREFQKQVCQNVSELKVAVEQLLKDCMKRLENDLNSTANQIRAKIQLVKTVSCQIHTPVKANGSKPPMLKKATISSSEQKSEPQSLKRTVPLKGEEKGKMNRQYIDQNQIVQLEKIIKRQMKSIEEDNKKVEQNLLKEVEKERAKVSRELQIEKKKFKDLDEKYKELKRQKLKLKQEGNKEIERVRKQFEEKINIQSQKTKEKEEIYLKQNEKQTFSKTKGQISHKFVSNFMRSQPQVFDFISAQIELITHNKIIKSELVFQSDPRNSNIGNYLRDENGQVFPFAILFYSKNGNIFGGYSSYLAIEKVKKQDWKAFLFNASDKKIFIANNQSQKEFIVPAMFVDNLLVLGNRELVLKSNVMKTLKVNCGSIFGGECYQVIRREFLTGSMDQQLQLSSVELHRLYF